ncbi:hypothetical protein AB0F15_05605 [Amycolatopsis sp. NPDC026612]
MSPEEKFVGLVDEFTGRPGITPPGATGGFGSTQPWSALAEEAAEFVGRK